eukprot:TRINITY_DN1707_c0_g2_i1.p1 TRINITY_DN1707_c0_g2~~TRINITY_DN1707_c0_g2_i1.p1  ORF type:complete len:136 (-),score=7.97 TRINITY_DN1707_c0_g2_i1:1071-1478(-)
MLQDEVGAVEQLGAPLRPAAVLPAVLGVLRLLGVPIQALVDGGLDLVCTKQGFDRIPRLQSRLPDAVDLLFPSGALRCGRYLADGRTPVVPVPAPRPGLYPPVVVHEMNQPQVGEQRIQQLVSVQVEVCGAGAGL